MRIPSILTAALLVTAAFGTGPAAAQQQGPWPNRTIKLISPFNPGGAIDVLNRVLAEKLAARIGQPVIVEAVPGANTIKGAEALAHAPADGYAFMITTMSTTVNNVVLYPKLPYEPGRDFMPVTQLSLGSVLLVAPVDAPYSVAMSRVSLRGRRRRIGRSALGRGGSGRRRICTARYCAVTMAST